MPVAISFTVETDGRLPTGQTLAAAIEQVDAATSGSPVYYMVNCAHSTHFDYVLDESQAWSRRIRGLRANASSKSHAELNDSPVLDAGDPQEFGRQYAALKRRHPQINVMGGCCGTDYRHRAGGPGMWTPFLRRFPASVARNPGRRSGVQQRPTGSPGDDCHRDHDCNEASENRDVMRFRGMRVTSGQSGNVPTGVAKPDLQDRVRDEREAGQGEFPKADLGGTEHVAHHCRIQWG